MSERNSSPPEELATAMRSAVENNPSSTAPQLLDAAERLLDRVLRTNCESRDSALDLLTVDALMTHALEIAAKDPKAMQDFAEQAMQRIASHVRENS